MALSPEDLQALAGLIDTKVTAAVDAIKGDVKAVQATPAVEDVEAAVEDYVHLADGNVVTMPQGEVGTHVDGVAVIGKYQVGA
jgi:hypothetical protein